MNEETIKMIVDDTIEELHDRGYLRENDYGRIPADLPETIAETLMEKYS